MWQSYGKGKTQAQLQFTHSITSTAKKQKCEGPCGKTLPLDDFGVWKRRNGRRKVCQICRATNESAKNDRTRPGADRLRQLWTREEIKFVVERRDLPDDVIARHLKRTIAAVRGRRRILGLSHKRGKPTPKPVFNEFGQHREDSIKAITVETIGNKIMVYCNTHTRQINIFAAFISKGLTGEDFKAWEIGVTAGC